MGIKAVISLQKASRTYRQGETILGTFEVETGNQEVTHEGITLFLDGHIALLRPKMSLTDKEVIPLVESSVQIVMPGKLPASKKEALKIPFQMVLEKTLTELFETYHGVYLNVQYTIRGEVKRHLLAQKISTSPLEIFVESRPMENPNALTKEFILTPASIIETAEEDDRKRSNNNLVPNNIDFEIKGQMDSTAFHMDEPLSGQICIHKTTKAIKSIEIQLIRVEELPKEEFKQASEVQNIQVAQGNVQHGVNISLYMLFPRYFSCPSKTTSAFAISFQINICVIFEDNYVVSKNVPIQLYR